MDDIKGNDEDLAGLEGIINVRTDNVRCETRRRSMR